MTGVLLGEQNCRHHPYHPTGAIKEGPTAVTWVDGRVRLDDVEYRPTQPAPQLPSNAPDYVRPAILVARGEMRDFDQ